MSLAIRKNLTPEPEVETNSGKSRFSLPKFSLSKKSLTQFLRKPRKSEGKVMDLADLPQLREVDSHPDAPARRPIFAESDLGSPLAAKIQPFEESPAAPPVQESPVPVSPQAITPDPVASPFVAEKSPQMPPVSESVAEVQTPAPAVQESAPVAEQPQLVVAEPVSQEDMSGLSVAQLADRLESGIERLRQLEQARHAVPPAPTSAPVAEQAPAPLQMGSFNVTTTEAPVEAQPPLQPAPETEVEVQHARQADMDAALKAALGTLEKMTAHR